MFIVCFKWFDLRINEPYTYEQNTWKVQLVENNKYLSHK